MRNYLNQFNLETFPVRAEILALNLQDVSWGNDVCPSFLIRGNGEGTPDDVVLWVDAIDCYDREDDSGRYVIIKNQDIIFSSESTIETVEYIKANLT